MAAVVRLSVTRGSGFMSDTPTFRPTRGETAVEIVAILTLCVAWLLVALLTFAVPLGIVALIVWGAVRIFGGEAP